MPKRYIRHEHAKEETARIGEQNSNQQPPDEDELFGSNNTGEPQDNDPIDEDDIEAANALLQRLQDNPSLLSRTYKKPKLNQVLLLWTQEEEEDEEFDLTPRHTYIKNLVKNHTRDINECVQLITNKGKLPNFPRDLWKAILDTFVKFEYILADEFSTTATEDIIPENGVTIPTRINKTKVPVNTTHDWHAVWQIYARAVTTIFPTHKIELEKYDQHMCKLFHATPSQSTIASLPMTMLSADSLAKNAMCCLMNSENSSTFSEPSLTSQLTVLLAETQKMLARVQTMPGSLPAEKCAETGTHCRDIIVNGLTNGFWPWAKTNYDSGYPTTWDSSFVPPASEPEQVFLNNQRDIKIQKGQFSPTFGPDLLPGMYSNPILAIPKPNSPDLCLVSHQRAGQYCQNSMIDQTQTKGPRMDTFQQFIPALLNYKWKHPNEEHPLWQIKQVVTTNLPTKDQLAAGTDIGPPKQNVNLNSCFGDRGSPRIWASVMGLVI
ncbi:hypothetical protein BDP27DRAFT_1424333 [Rhodocollybia butyracea]|uniref:Uncharacterized protein n=1 Tax=Rhodocollybia butyracea TaxID=206335 RepID=A0A9P5U4R6_9AGAR|nr:hypothetical protein BDP27DRAFT_1424333 [Rhodocollybia butyracea]